MVISLYRPGRREQELLAKLEVLRRQRIATWPADFASRNGFSLKIPQQYRQLRWEVFRYAQESAPERVKGQRLPERPNLPLPNDPYVNELEARVRELRAQVAAVSTERDALSEQLIESTRILEALRAANIELFRRVRGKHIPGEEAEFLSKVWRVLEDRPIHDDRAIDLAAERSRRSATDARPVE